ncbi:hypothetical protein FGG08_001693 [Glutinoglossum americanum]|uniref:Uncharacterized protein n=1 Tax=Glutinoglossum americanum TaxID=1670608 RepID=A0A9P8ID26_9PEZI|nr:hypothetical protein FGG08_001693 [Glutinoglossum americanum]
MPLRNPFKKTPGLESAHDENDRPGSRSGSEPDLERPPVSTSTRPTAPLSIKGGREEEPDEYKLCGVFPHCLSPRNLPGPAGPLQTRSTLTPFVNDSGVYLPDISARSPVVRYDVTPPRKSLDSRAMRLPRSVMNEKRIGREPPTAEELFEDVGLNDEPKPKKKGLFSRFGDASDAANTSSPASNFTHYSFHFNSRKRGHSGQGAELGKIEKPQDASEIKSDE